MSFYKHETFIRNTNLRANKFIYELGQLLLYTNLLMKMVEIKND